MGPIASDSTCQIHEKCSSSRTDFEANTLFEVPQEMESIFSLDGGDELLDDLNRVWRHCSGPGSGVTVSFMFRNVQKTSEVLCSEGLPTHVNMSEKSGRMFEEAEELCHIQHHRPRNNVCTLEELQMR